MKKSKIGYSFLVFATILAFAIGPKVASAIPISGSIGFGGQIVSPIDSGGNTVSDFSAPGATGLDFGGAIVTSATGDYAAAGFAFLNPVTFTDFQFTPSGIVTPLWTSTNAGTTAFFDLVSVTVDQQTATDLDLTGTGFLELTGIISRDRTEGTWSFSGDTTGGGVFSFSTTSTSVPEPGTIALLGIGLAGLVGVGMRRKMKKNVD